MESKIRIKMGQIEIDFEGSEGFLREGLLEFIKTTSEIVSSSRLPVDSSSTAPTNHHIEQDSPSQSDNNISGTTNSIAAKLGVKKGPDLVMAAGAHITFVKKQDKFHHTDLSREMRLATHYYKKSYLNNLPRTLKTLTKKGELIEHSKDMYVLSGDKIKELEAKLAR